MVRWTVAALLLVGIAGCVEESPADEPTAAAGPLVMMSWPRHVTEDVHHAYVDPPVRALAPDMVIDIHNVDHGFPRPDCAAGCILNIDLAVPDDVGEAWLEARVVWDGTSTSGFTVALEGPVAARGMQRGYDTARDQVWDPVPGNYTLTVQGDGLFHGWVRLFEKDGLKLPGDDRLPNLVTLAPNQIAVQDCLPEEIVEQQALRCLRLGNAVANLGDGPLEVHLDWTNGGLSAAGEGRFVQRLYGAEGHRDVPVGPAQFHATHGHFHYHGLAEFSLFEYDPDTGLRGAEAGRHMKQGFCFLDWGRMEDPEADPNAPRHAEQACLVPDFQEGWSMGISVGWYDFYWAALADQYVEISGVPDGVYELVSVADGGNTLVETDETDNVASAIIRLQGDAATTLERRAFYTNPED